MADLNSKKILLGVTGSIAAYKITYLTRLLVKAGNEVKILMTNAAQDFITPLTLSTLSKNDVHHDIADETGWNNHVELGLWADAMVIAPCTANSLAKIAHGLADNLVIASYLSAKCPIFIAPAMDLDMWKHPSTQQNIQKVTDFGNHIIPVAHGELASGLIGAGRMAEPETIIEFLSDHFKKKNDLKGKTVIVTAGPTYEHIDPVRFIGNPSSGKMGIALADECADRGAQVVLVLGPSRLKPSNTSIQVEKVKSAAEMYNAVDQHYTAADICIFAAAVADYTPLDYSDQKIKKKEGDLSINLKRTIDIAGTLGKKKKAEQIHIGFALETQNEESNAKGKLERKNFDMIVLNSLNDKGAGFQGDTNKIKLFKKDGSFLEYPLKSKKKVAQDIVNELTQIIHS